MFGSPFLVILGLHGPFWAHPVQHSQPNCHPTSPLDTSMAEIPASKLHLASFAKPSTCPNTIICMALARSANYHFRNMLLHHMHFTRLCCDLRKERAPTASQSRRAISAAALFFESACTNPSKIKREERAPRATSDHKQARLKTAHGRVEGMVCGACLTRKGPRMACFVRAHAHHTCCAATANLHDMHSRSKNKDFNLPLQNPKISPRTPQTPQD